jgi:hypothetical protein
MQYSHIKAVRDLLRFAPVPNLDKSVVQQTILDAQLIQLPPQPVVQIAINLLQ